MAKQLTPAQIEAAFRKWHVNFITHPGWQTRGYGPGSITDAEFVVIHHTGGTAQSNDYLNFLFVDGRADVPAPLCNWATRANGQLILGAAERANHAGEGSLATLNKVTSGNYSWKTQEIAPGVDNFNGNSRSYGNEVMYSGGAPMTEAAYVTMVLSSAAICDAHGWGAWRVIGHREHSGRKIDPGKELMYLIRRDVDAALKAGPGNWPTPQEEPMSADDVQALKSYIDAKFAATFGPGGTESGRYEQDITEGRQQTAELATLMANMQKWMNDEEVEEDFRDQLAGDRWGQGTREGREQAAAILADAQTKLEALQGKLDSALSELAAIKAQTTSPVTPPAEGLPKA